jgi:hypothetical protein
MPESEEDEIVEYWENRLALPTILWAVLPEMLASLATKRTTKLAWEAIKSHCIGVERVREENTE